jgi:mannose-1-phosphate guanylyltransferase
VDDDREHCLLVNGDTLTDLDPRALIEAHVASDALVTMALIPNPSPDKYGGVRIDDDGVITAFTRPGSEGESYHFIGAQVAAGRAFAALEDGVHADSVGGHYPRLMRDCPRSIRAFLCHASFQDIGTPADCLATSLALTGIEGNRLISPSADVHESAQIVRTALWDDVRVARHVHLTDCIVADGVSLPEGSRYERCAIVRAGDRPPRSDERVVGGVLIRSF